ncbi:MAG: endopeptidase La [Ruminococcaceae bacterium]|nr:endopeptidase La [Oscillospiraceae bacterium]
MDKEKILDEKVRLPVIPLRGLSVFPGMLINFDVERPMSIAALNMAMNFDQVIFLTAQKEIAKEIPHEEDIYHVGTVCKVRQLLRQPGSKVVRVMAEGIDRGKIRTFISLKPAIIADIEPMPDVLEKETNRTEALRRRSISMFGEYAEESGNIARESVISILDSTDSAYVADYIAQNIYLKPQDKQSLLEEQRPSKRLLQLCRLLAQEITYLRIERDLNEITHEQMSRNQKEYYLREQLKVIQAELGEEDSSSDVEDYKTKILSLGLDEESEQKLLKENKRLAKQPFGSAEASVIRSYLDTCLDIPWNKSTKERLDLDASKKILDADHFGLAKVKERILEYLAVRRMATDIKGGVLCLVGPPGTGKTSVAMSIARATNRKLCRVALGGVHDEAEIRGHRKTYVGSMPGRIVAGLIQAGSMNPLMVLDEIDKLGSDFRGDPSSALLEVLDGEQNCHFRDNFVEIPIDLSDVFFITTANSVESIPRPLLDRMEILELSSYTDEEKLQIAKRHLLPKQRKKHGLTGNHLRFSDEAFKKLISSYTRESGVRELERQIAAICRKCVFLIEKGEVKSLSVVPNKLESLLGPAKYKPDIASDNPQIGLVKGLAWTAVGGEVLNVEAGVVDGSGKLELTGNIGDVMKESCKAAISYIRSRTEFLNIDPMFYKNKDIHIHFPEGAVPKDGPSAGITICISVISALTGRAASSEVAMTGEITLRGRILAIGGLKEKTMAALRSGVKTVIIPNENRSDLEEIDQTVRAKLNFVFADNLDEIIDIALLPLKIEEDAKKAELNMLPVSGAVNTVSKRLGQ